MGPFALLALGVSAPRMFASVLVLTDQEFWPGEPAYGCVEDHLPLGA